MGKVIIPSGSQLYNGGDTIIVITLQRASSKDINDIFAED